MSLSSTLKHRLLAFAAATSLFVWAPVSAEYLYDYLDSTGNWSELLLGLLILGPLYGAPAILIREFAVRTGRGWRSIAMLAAAFGFLQAGIVDKSLFNLNFGGYDEIAAMGNPTYIAAIGVSVYNMLLFVGNHVVFSICAPIAMVEGIFSSAASRKWINWFGIAFLLFLYVAASLLVHNDISESDSFMPSMKQIALCLTLVLSLCVGVFFLPRTHQRDSKMVIFLPWMALIGFSAAGLCHVVSFVANLVGYEAFDASWPGTILYAFVLALTAIWLHRASKSESFGQLHVLYLSCGAVWWTVITAMLSSPMGKVTAENKFSHGIAMILLVLIVSVLAVRNTIFNFRMNREIELGDLLEESP